MFDSHTASVLANPAHSFISSKSYRSLAFLLYLDPSAPEFHLCSDRVGLFHLEILVALILYGMKAIQEIHYSKYS